MTNKKPYPSAWKCYELNRLMEISRDALPNCYYGFICDCGRWVLKTDKYHKVTQTKSFNIEGFPYDIIHPPPPYSYDFYYNITTYYPTITSVDTITTEHTGTF